MQLPIVTEISALSAHRREVDLVRWSLMAVPEAGSGKRHDPADPLRRIQRLRGVHDGVDADGAAGERD